MLINRLFPINTQLTRLKEIPDTFFAKLEDAKAFDSSLFPIWLTDARGRPTVFGSRTDLREKFKAIYDKYKDIVNVAERRKVIVAYFETNKIIDLCNNEENTEYFELTDLPKSITEEIDDAFLYLYNSGLSHPEFETYVGNNLKIALKGYTDLNGIEICPFCGLELLLQIDGQARLPLDHWLNKDRFPFASINFLNLIPIGSYCNSNGVKGEKNVLRNIKLRPRTKSYYPYSENKGTKISITCLEEPNVDNDLGEWDLTVSANADIEIEIFESWDYVFNISTRFKSYFIDTLIPGWKNRYTEYIKNEDDDIEVEHAQTIEEFKSNLTQWKKTFDKKRIHASIIYREFIDYLLNRASDDYLYGLVESFKSKVAAEL